MKMIFKIMKELQWYTRKYLMYKKMQEWKERSGTKKIQKTSTKMEKINPSLSVILLSVDGLNPLTKEIGRMDFFNDPATHCLKRFTLDSKAQTD